MATLPPGLTQGDIDEYARLDAGIKKLKQRHDILNEKIKKTHEDAGIKGKKTLVYDSEKYGSVIVDLSEAKSVDTEKLESAHPFEQNPEFYKPKLDTKSVPADILAKFRTIITQRLSIKTGE